MSGSNGDRHSKLSKWVAEVANLTMPKSVVWCDGSEDEAGRLANNLVDAGVFTKLDETKWGPNSYHAVTHQSDVARVVERTFICSEREEDAGPTNNWVEPSIMREELNGKLAGSMRGRTMYVVPFSMGPIGSELSYTGVELTDSPYVVLNMRIMTRMGNDVLEELGDGDFVKCLHTVGAPLAPGQDDSAWPCQPEVKDKYIVHFPETREIVSYGSGYGGNALLGKKCFALRIASVIARDEGWFAEHMAIIKVTNPEGKVKYLTAAFPSACGKTNFAMLESSLPGWKVETIGDDICWMRFDEEGVLRAINPEAGFFGVAPGTGIETNANAIKALRKGNSIFTNVGVTPDGDVWWEGLGEKAPEGLIDWKGKAYDAEVSLAAHANARFTTPYASAPTALEDEWNDSKGVPISAILYGGRRPSTVPLVRQAYGWEHGVFMASTLASETTAAAISDNVGQLAYDPWAMKPFFGYNISDYARHHIDMGANAKPDKLPEIFAVNWFRKGPDDKFIWPGFGENIRVIRWIFERLDGVNDDIVESPIGLLPSGASSVFDGLDFTPCEIADLIEFGPEAWKEEVPKHQEHLESFGDPPQELLNQLELLREALNNAS